MYISSDSYTQRGAFHVDSLQPCEDSMSTYTRHAEQKLYHLHLTYFAVNILFQDRLGGVPSFLWFSEDFAAEFGPLSIDPNQHVRRSIRAKAHGTSTACEVWRHFLPSSPRPPPLRRLRHDAEYRVVAADARPDLLVVFLGVAHLVKLRLPKQKRSVKNSDQITRVRFYFHEIK